MADITREEAIKIFNTVLLFGNCSCPKEEAEECLKMAISDMERVEELEADNKQLRQALKILQDDMSALKEVLEDRRERGVLSL